MAPNDYAPVVNDAMRALGPERWRDGVIYVPAEAVAALLQRWHMQHLDTVISLEARSRELEHLRGLLAALQEQRWRFAQRSAG